MSKNLKLPLLFFNILYLGNTNKLPQSNPFALQQQLRQSSSHSEYHKV